MFKKISYDPEIPSLQIKGRPLVLKGQATQYKQTSTVYTYTRTDTNKQNTTNTRFPILQDDRYAKMTQKTYSTKQN